MFLFYFIIYFLKVLLYNVLINVARVLNNQKMDNKLIYPSLHLVKATVTKNSFCNQCKTLYVYRLLMETLKGHHVTLTCRSKNNHKYKIFCVNYTLKHLGGMRQNIIFFGFYLCKVNKYMSAYSQTLHSHYHS